MFDTEQFLSYAVALGLVVWHIPCDESQDQEVPADEPDVDKEREKASVVVGLRLVADADLAPRPMAFRTTRRALPAPCRPHELLQMFQSHTLASTSSVQSENNAF